MILKRSQKEGSKSTPDRSRHFQSILLDEVLKEALGYILRIVRIIAATPRKRVNWIPILPA
jgi:hypothetical protein